MHYIYKITNSINHKVYIGQTVCPRKRFWEHRNCFTRSHAKKNKVYHLYKSMAKYGIDCFIFEIIDFGFTQSQTDCIEVGLINLYESRNPEKGYNKAVGGKTSGMLNLTHSEEWRKNHSKWMKEHPNSGQFTSERMKGNQVNLGRKHSDEVNKKKGKKGGNSTSFKPGQSIPAYHKGKTWKLVNGKRTWSIR